MFYVNFINLCNSIGKSPSAVAEEIGIMRSTVTRWKQGKSQTDANIQKVANYFGVTVEELTTESKKSPTPESVELSKFDLDILESMYKLTPADRIRVEAYIQGLIAARKD